MLSICIPVYNYNIVTLVRELQKQCTECKIPFEIICIDDASSFHKEENKTLATFSGVKYEALPKNIGRAAIRNKLAEEAVFDHLLFLDCDVAVSNPGFIKTYLGTISSSAIVAVGGRLYEQKKTSRESGLHFNYGRSREVIPATVRKANPYASFVTGNFLIQKKIFNTISFLSTLTEYGHEDTLFGIELQKHNIPITHIDNPVVHLGLEKNTIFIQKQLTAVKNLSILIEQGYDLKTIYLYRFYLQLKKYRLVGLFIFCFRPVQPLVKKILQSGGSSWLVLFDLLRLYELCKLNC